MIDAFSLLLSHGLIFITLWRLISHNNLDREDHDKVDVLSISSKNSNINKNEDLHMKKDDFHA